MDESPIGDCQRREVRMLLQTIPDADWWEFAACATVDAERFFPDGRGTHLRRQIDAAKAICASCPVRTRCLSWALTMNVSGVWGGCSEYERRKIKAGANGSAQSTTDIAA